MKNNLILETAHLLLKYNIQSNDIVIDATMGNGNDTVFLAEHAKFVYAFDIQQQALTETQKKLDQGQIKNVQLILDSHEFFNKYVTEFKGVVFNLGYLPKGDKSITTQTDITIRTLSLMLPYLKENGFILIVVYRGHLEGNLESIALTSYLGEINPLFYKLLKVDLPFQDNQPPYIYMIKKIKDESN